MRRVGYFSGGEGVETFDDQILGIRVTYVPQGNMITGKLMTKEPTLGEIDFRVNAYLRLVEWVYYHYNLKGMSQRKLGSIVRNEFSNLMLTVGDDILSWVVDKLMREIQRQRVLRLYESDEYLEDYGLIDLEKYIIETLSEFFVYGVVLPLMNGDFDEAGIVVFIKSRGVEALITEMKKKYGNVRKTITPTGKVENEEDLRDAIAKDLAEEPMTLVEIASKYGITVPYAKRILKEIGAIEDPMTGLWYIPSATYADEVYTILYNHALEEKSSIMSLDEALRVLREHGYSDRWASAYISYLNTIGKIEVRNGLIEIPEVKEKLTIKTSEGTGEKIEEESAENELEEIRQLAHDYAKGEVDTSDIIDVFIDGAKTLNKTTFTKVCRVFMDTLKADNVEKYKELTRVLRSEFGTYSCSKLYDAIRAIYVEGQPEKTEEPVEKSIEESHEEGSKEETEGEESVKEEEIKSEEEASKAEEKTSEEAEHGE